MIITGIVVILVVRLLGPEEYGKYALVWQLVGTVGPILSLGWHPTLAKFLPEKTEQEKKILFSQSLISVLVICLFFFIVGYFVIQFFPKIIPVEIKQIKIVFLLFIILVAFFNVFEGFYRGLGKFNQWTVIDGLRSNLGNVLAIVLLIIGYRYYQTVIFSNFIFAVLFVILLFNYLIKYLNVNIGIDNFGVEKPVRNFALTMFIGQIVYLLGTSIDSILLRALFKYPAQVGYYNAGIRIPKIIETMLIAPLSTPFLYYFSHPETSENRKKIIEFGTKMLGIICGLMSLFLFSFAKEIILFLFGQTYSESIMVLRIFSLTLFILGFFILLSPYFLSINKPLIPIVLGFFTFLLFFAFDLLLIPQLKSTGPAVSMLVGLIIQALSMLYILLRWGVKCLANFILLFFCIAVSVVVGFYLSFYISLPAFVILIWLTRLFTLNDIKTWRKILLKGG
jgi:PST family polysaccharide transporter